MAARRDEPTRVAPFGALRQNLTLWSAPAWAAERPLFPHCAAYSSMAHGLRDGDVALLFEGVFDDPKFPCAHGGSAAYSVAITEFSVAAAAAR